MPQKVRSQKSELVFDSKDREAFLTGFSKRKQARKKAAILNAEKQYKDEVARIKSEKRERIKQRLEEVSSVRRANGIELSQLAENEAESEKILDLPQHVVTITSTEEMDLSKCGDSAYLGSNNSKSDFVEVVDTEINCTKNDEQTSSIIESDDQTNKDSNPTKRKSGSRVAEFARRAQMLKSKKRPRKPVESGRMSKSQKKFLKKKSKNKAKSSR